jgi:gluconokinase
MSFLLKKPIQNSQQQYMQQPYIIGLDIGTGSTKAVAISFQGNIINVSQFSYPTLQPEPGYSEQEPEDIWEAFQKCIQETLEKVGHMPRALSLSSAMHSIIPVRSDGTALANLITWADSRSEVIAEGLRAGPEGENIYRTSGTPIHAMAPLSKLIWLKEHRPALYEETYKFISIKEYIWFKLFRTFEIDFSIACATGLFDIVSRNWSADIISHAGLKETLFSSPVNTTFYRNNMEAQVAAGLGLALDTPVVIGASDGCSANLGSAIVDASKAALTIGTSGAVRVTSTRPIYNFPAMTFNYLLDEQTYVCGGPVNNGGAAIDWGIRTFLSDAAGSAEAYDIFFAGADGIPAGAEGLIFLPYLTGERAPIWDTRSSGTFLGITSQHTPAHFFRAILEGVCFALNQVLLTIEEALDPVTDLHVSGGFINSPVWLQLLADLTGKKLVVVQSEDASAIGAAILASRALYPGQLNLENTLLSSENINVYPDMEKHSVYKAIMPIYHKLYFDLKASMHLLNQLNN